MIQREKTHRLSREYYKGMISAAFTLCLMRDVAAGFSLCDAEVESAFTGALATAAAKTGCIIPMYCTMPDHQHIIITGTRSESDLWKAVAIR